MTKIEKIPSGGKSFREIGLTLGIAPATAEGIYRQALRKLKLSLGRSGKEDLIQQVQYLSQFEFMQKFERV